MTNVNGWLLAVQKKIAVDLYALNRKELLVAAVFILFKLGAETVVIPLIIFFKRQTEKLLESTETVKRFSTSCGLSKPQTSPNCP